MQEINCKRVSKSVRAKRKRQWVTHLQIMAHNLEGWFPQGRNLLDGPFLVLRTSQRIKISKPVRLCILAG